MSIALSPDTSSYIRLGAAGALGAVTLLWSGGANSGFFQAGTVLLVISLIPLARGLGARAGALIGLLLSAVWIAARIGFSRTLDLDLVLCEVNIIIVAAMVTIGGLAGILLYAGPAESYAAAAISRIGPTPGSPAESAVGADEAGSTWAEALARHREWMAALDPAAYPWTSFDTHIRELVRLLANVQRLRCYRVSQQGQLFALGRDDQKTAVNAAESRLLAHVITTGRRFVAGTASAGPLIQELAADAGKPIAWAVPIREQQATIGLITAESVHPGVRESQLQGVGDLVEQFWLHVHHLDLLRMARQTDRGSGLINRTEFLGFLKKTLEACYKAHEPVVVMVVCLEGLRGLDDASQWSKRDDLIEAVGQTIAAGIRKDDMVGRFSDAQFIALLRRLDVPLAELICRKLLGSIAKVISEFELATWVTPRAGLTGSGFGRPDAEEMLRHAISALQKARSQDLLLVSEQLVGGAGES